MTIESLQSLKNAVLETIGKGLDFDSACVLANVDDDTKKLMQEDTAFQYIVRQKSTLLELTLMERVLHFASKGQTSIESRWLLERLNPRWAKSQEAGGGGSGSYEIPTDFENV